ncbi:MAG: class I SAM-dependent methyltransferase [Thermodesulfobacteriota bacterium]
MGRFEYIDRPGCVCGSELGGGGFKITRKFAWGEVTFIRCPQCGSMIQSPQITTRSLASWYDSPEYHAGQGRSGGAYLDYLAGEKHRRIEAAGRYERDLAGRMAPGSRILEVGCATGSLLSVLRDRGHQVVGVDLSTHFVAQARRLYDLDVRAGDLLAVDLPEAAFHLIVMLGTISNLQDLPAHLARVHQLLRPGGLLFFNMPEARSLPARIYGKNFWMYAPSVSSFMTILGAGLALGRAGFQVERCRVDFQEPTLTKLLGHARLHRLYPILGRLGLDSMRLPFPMPIPGVLAVWAVKKGPALIGHRLI